jgi:hypothetical protein
VPFSDQLVAASLKQCGLSYGVPKVGFWIFVLEVDEFANEKKSSAIGMAAVINSVAYCATIQR